MVKYTIRTIRKKEEPLWDDFVEKSEQGTLFHTSKWLNMFGGSIIAAFNSNNEIMAGMPIAQGKLRFKKVCKNPTLTPYQGIICKKPGSRLKNYSKYKKTATLILEHILETQKNILIKLSPWVSDIQPYLWKGFFSSVSYTYLLDIGNLDTVYSGMHKNLRGAIKKANKDGLHVKKSNDYAMFNDLIKKTFGRQGKNISYKDILESIKRNKFGQVFITYSDKTPIAGIYIVHDTKRSYYLLGGYDSEKGHYGGTALALWEAIKYTKKTLKLNEFDFEGSTVPEIERFFRQFGGRLVPVYSVRRFSAIFEFLFTLYHIRQNDLLPRPKGRGI